MRVICSIAMHWNGQTVGSWTLGNPKQNKFLTDWGLVKRSCTLPFLAFYHLFRPGPCLFLLGFTPFTTFHFLPISLSQLFLSFLSTVVIQDYKEKKTIFLKHNIFYAIPANTCCLLKTKNLAILMKRPGLYINK